jgi:hypothetical protein
VDDPIIWVNAEAFAHLVTEKKDDAKEVKFRQSLLAAVANVGQAVLGSLETRSDGSKTLRVLIPFNGDVMTEQSSDPTKAERPTALILWFDDSMRVRTVFPSTRKRFLSDALKRGDRLIDLGE